MMRKAFCAVVVCAVAGLGGCATTREQQLEARAERVEQMLKLEQGRVLAGGFADRDARLNHLSTLRTELSLANVARGSVPRLVPPEDRDLAWDVLDEVYGTLEWNIPLGPNVPMRPMPAQFQNGVLNLNAARGGASMPRGTSGATSGGRTGGIAR